MTWIFGWPVALAVAASLAIPSPAAATEFKAQFLCNDRGTAFPLAGVQVELGRLDPGAPDYLPRWFTATVVQRSRTDGDGRVSINVGGPEANFFFRLVLTDGRFNGVGARDWWAQQLWSTETDTNQNDRFVQDYGAQVLGDGRGSPECALFEGVRRAHDDYNATAGDEAPYVTAVLNAPTRHGGSLARIRSILFPPQFEPGLAPGTFTSASREFGKLALHHAEGLSEAHLDEHMRMFGDFDDPERPCTRTNPGHAFNDGWGEWWARDYAPAPNCRNVASNDYSVPGNVAAALASQERLCGGRRAMVAALRRRGAHPVHTFVEFRRALDCLPGASTPGAASRDFAGISIDRITAFGRRQLGDLDRVAAGVRRELRVAVARSRRARPCPPLPCTDTLASVAVLHLLRAQLGQAVLLRRTLSFAASRRGLRRVGGSSVRQLRRALDARARAFQLGSARTGALEVRRALDAAALILRRDRSALTQAIARRLRVALTTFRARRLPRGFLLPTPGGSRLIQGPATPPSPPPPPQPPPPPGAMPDLVVARVYQVANNGCCDMTVDVANQGNGSAGPSKTEITQEGQAPVLVDTPALGPGERATVTAYCVYGGSGNVSARDDATGVVGESDENNNTGSGTVGVGGLCRYN
jgi:hypothetical protein